MDGVLEASFTSLVRRLYINFMAAKYISYIKYQIFTHQN